MTTFDRHVCTLGEGPLWHPERQSLIWFDILEKRMFERRGDARQDWQFDEHVSAAGWVDDATVLMASETGLWRFDLETGKRELHMALEADNGLTRSNDGRADPWGGFWIGTMGKNAEPGLGAIYRFWQGTLREIIKDITISNAICFAPDRSHAYYTDTPTRTVMRLPLHADTGWPSGDATPFIDLNAQGQNPDGAVTDAQGNIWIALWGAAQVVCYDATGTFTRAVDLSATQPTCPAFGGADLRDLMVTSAADSLETDADSRDGMTLLQTDVAQGLAEPRVTL